MSDLSETAMSGRERGVVTDLSACEVLTGVVYGQEPSAPPESAQDPGPLEALEAALLPALRRPPCGVGFSGGRDSSALLAVAVAVARREGLPDPVAVTLEFSAASASATVERAWQERVLGHLGVSEWVRLAQDDELDVVGPVAERGLVRHGLLFPANAHFVVPMARAVAGGSIVIGFGGDDVLGSWRFHHLASLLAGRRRPTRGDLRAIAYWSMSADARAQIFRRRELVCSLPWLRPPARGQASLRVARELCAAPRTWPGRMGWLSGWRTLRVSERSIIRLGADEGARVVCPLIDPGFLAALGAAGGRWGWGNRTAVMRALFSGHLPEAVLERRSKAEFSAAVFGPATRRFAATWDGITGIDPELVDSGVARAVWSLPRPHFLSSTLLQAAWLHTRLAGAARVC